MFLMAARKRAIISRLTPVSFDTSEHDSLLARIRSFRREDYGKGYNLSSPFGLFLAKINGVDAYSLMIPPRNETGDQNVDRTSDWAIVQGQVPPNACSGLRKWSEAARDCIIM